MLPTPSSPPSATTSAARPIARLLRGGICGASCSELGVDPRGALSRHIVRMSRNRPLRKLLDRIDVLLFYEGSAHWIELTDLDDILKDRITTLKSDRDRAKEALARITIHPKLDAFSAELRVHLLLTQCLRGFLASVK
jgi:hypothetical protein